jgi:hypothetical protein
MANLPRTNNAGPVHATPRTKGTSDHTLYVRLPPKALYLCFVNADHAASLRINTAPFHRLQRAHHHRSLRLIERTSRSIVPFLAPVQTVPQLMWPVLMRHPPPQSLWQIQPGDLRLQHPYIGPHGTQFSWYEMLAWTHNALDCNRCKPISATFQVGRRLLCCVSAKHWHHARPWSAPGLQKAQGGEAGKQ